MHASAPPANIPAPPFSGLEIGPLNLNLYGLAIASGVLAAVWLARRRFMAGGGDPVVVERVAVWAVVAGVVGARVGFVLPRLDRFRDDPMEAFAIWEGGLTFFGALAGGAIGALWALRRENASVSLFLTAAAPAIPLAQALGRWGNYFNQELYGRPTDLPWALEVDPQHVVPRYAGHETFHPTFAYEMVWNFALVAGLIWLGRRVALRSGSLFFVYMIGYGIGRFLLELVRVDTEFRVLGISRNGYNSIGVALAGVALLWWWERRTEPEPDPDPDTEPDPDTDPDTEPDPDLDTDEPSSDVAGSDTR